MRHQQPHTLVSVPRYDNQSEAQCNVEVIVDVGG